MKDIFFIIKDENNLIQTFVAKSDIDAKIHLEKVRKKYCNGEFSKWELYSLLKNNLRKVDEKWN